MSYGWNQSTFRARGIPGQRNSFQTFPSYTSCNVDVWTRLFLQSSVFSKTRASRLFLAHVPAHCNEQEVRTGRKFRGFLGG